MEVCRITAQSQPLDEYYASLADDPRTSPDFAELGRRMRDLVRLFPAIAGPPVWAVTSHAHLHLVAADDYREPSLVAVWGGGFGDAFSYAVEYAVPAAEAPWPGARMLLGTPDVRQACAMVAYGLGKATGTAYSFGGNDEPDAAGGA